MGLFRHRSPSASPARSSEEEPETEAVPKKTFVKEKAPAKCTNEADDETVANTKLNAMLYHILDDTIDLYRSENNSLDLLGRIYYDDYDPSDQTVVERVASFTSLSLMARSPPSALSSHSRLVPSPNPYKSLSSGSRPLYARQVSFDTLSDRHHLSITLKVKHPEFRFRRNNKTFLVGFTNDSESMKAVEWAFLEMVIHGDTIIVFQVLDEKNYSFVDPSLAEIVLEKLKRLNTHSKRISMVYEVVIGNPQKLLEAAINEYKPAMMIVGTRQYGSAGLGSSSLSLSLTNLSLLNQLPSQGLPNISQALSQAPSHITFPNHHHHSHHHRHMPFFSKSLMSKHFLQYALVPVILVKPFYEIQEKLDRPVDSESYFKDWLVNIDISLTKEKKKKRFGMRSPLSSRDSSHTSLTDLAKQESRGRAEKTSFSIGGSRDNSQAADEDGHHRLRSRLSRLFA